MPRLENSAPLTTIKNEHRCHHGAVDGPGRTRRISLADVSVFTGTPPTKPLVFEMEWSGDLFAQNKYG